MSADYSVEGSDTVQLGWQNTAPLAKASDLIISSACEFQLFAQNVIGQ
jgi:hypothetical protein